MRLVVFGLAVSSSWGNGHATLWRALGRAFEAIGGEILFFERNQSFYAAARDATALPGIRLVIYDDWDEVRDRARAEIRAAELSMVTSYCPDGPRAAELVRGQARLSAYYDMDTPVTLASLHGTPVPYLPRDGLRGFDLVLSYTGGRALDRLTAELGAARVRTLFGSVDPELYRPLDVDTQGPWAAITHLGTYAADRRAELDELFFTPARRLADQAFLLGGAQYPDDLPLPANVRHLPHVPPGDHRAFYGAAALTLNITRGTMKAMGHCPSGRLFEAAACRTPIISDRWEGLETFFTPGEEILVVESADDVLAALARGPTELRRIGARARERVLAEHTAHHRVQELLTILDERDRDRQAAPGTLPGKVQTA